MIAWCARSECKNEAELLPEVQLWVAAGRNPGPPQSRIQLGLPMCRRCAKDVTVSMLIPPGDWLTIVRAFMEAHGGLRPDLATAKVGWLPLNSPEALAFIATIPAPNKGLVH